MVVVRPARPGEGRRVVPAYEWLASAPGSPPPRWSGSVAETRLEDTIAGPRSLVLIATEGDDLVGFGTVYLDIVSVRFGQRAWVEDLAVSPERRSAGVGKALLDAAKRWAAEQGADRLGLESGDRRLDAHRFYEREQPASTSRAFTWNL